MVTRIYVDGNYILCSVPGKDCLGDAWVPENFAFHSGFGAQKKPTEILIGTTANTRLNFSLGYANAPICQVVWSWIGSPRSGMPSMAAFQNGGGQQVETLLTTNVDTTGINISTTLGIPWWDAIGGNRRLAVIVWRHPNG